MLRPPHRSGGFSLLELMVTITIVAVLTAIAVPSLRNTIQRNRVSSASNDLLASLAYARTAAITRGQIVSMCPSTTGKSCTTSGQAFEPGWIVYTYPAGPASANLAYAASSATMLRATGQRAGVSIHELQTPVISFGLQGQLSNGAPLVFLTCSRTADTGFGVSTAEIPGIQLDVNGTGSAMTTGMFPAAACSG
ncbi:MAG: GspH/FimT family pseudopilin [Rhodanobacter sp.]